MLKKLLLTFILFIFTTLFLFWPRIIFAQNLLRNPRFEEGDSGWNKYGSTQLTIVDNTLNGTKAGALTSDKTGTKYIYQDFETFEGEEFQLAGLIFWNDSSIANAKLRVEWLDSSLTRVGLDEIYLISRSSEWQYLVMNIKSAPLSKTARVEAYTSLNQGSPLNPVLFDDLVFEKVNQSVPTSTPNQSLTPTPTLISTPTPKPPTPTPKEIATYKINEVKDEDGEILKNVKVYVDGVYLHHYVPEVLTFCDDCQCDDYLSCGFGEHTIKLEKTGYEDWSKTITINPETADEVNPVMIFLESTSMPTPTSSPTSTPKPTIIPSLTPKPTSKTASDSGEVLGEEVATLSAFYPYQASDEAERNEASLSAKNRIFPKVFLGAGLLLVFAGAFWLWYRVWYTQSK